MASTDPFAGAMNATQKDPFAGALGAAPNDEPSGPLGAAEKLGGAALGGLVHLGKGALEAIAAPQRGVAGAGKYVEDQGLGGGKIFSQPEQLGAMLRQGKDWFMDPGKQDETNAYDRHVLSTENGGFIPSDEQINAHVSGPAATAARWAAQTGSEVLGDPTSIIPAGAIGKAAKIAGAGKLVDAIGKTKAGEMFSKAFNPEHNLGGLTERGQNLVEGTRNVFTQAAEKAKRVEDHAISQARNEIKNGVIPEDVAKAFKKYGAPMPEDVTKPSDLIHALDEARSAHVATQTAEQLKKYGLLPDSGVSPSLLQHRAVMAESQHGPLFKDAAAADEAREGVARHIAPDVAPEGPLAKAIAKTNQQLKSMFLAVPLPHVGNLINLAYNKYGLATTLRGLKYAAQEATGTQGEHLRALADELEKAGADNQYGKLFSETGTGALGEPLRQVQRFANAAQDKVLNPVERGLRASMLEKEMAGGRSGFDAARGVHKALGSDADTGMTKLLKKLPLSQFPRFHTQTALGSFGRTIADKPGRITGFEHAFGGPDQEPDGSPHFHLGTPTATGLGVAVNPLSLTNTSTLGMLTGITGPYSPIGLARKGYSAEQKGQRSAAQADYEKAVAEATKGLVPGSAAFLAVREILANKYGVAGETGAQDLVPVLTGGYFSKR